MRAHLDLAVGGGGIAASIGVQRDAARDLRPRPWLTAVLLLLTVPFTVALTADAIGYSLHLGYVLPAWLFGAGAPGLGRLLALGPPLALLILVALRVRLHAERSDGRWTGGVIARLTGWELAAGLLALLIFAVFFGHLAADSLACANGVRSAC